MSEPNYGPSRMVVRKPTAETSERGTESLVGKNRFDLAWAKVREQNAKGLNWKTHKNEQES